MSISIVMTDHHEQCNRQTIHKNLSTWVKKKMGKRRCLIPDRICIYASVDHQSHLNINIFMEAEIFSSWNYYCTIKRVKTMRKSIGVIINLSVYILSARAYHACRLLVTSVCIQCEQ